MVIAPRNRFAPLWALAALLLLLTVAGLAGLSAGQATASSATVGSHKGTTPPCRQLEHFDEDDFPRTPEIDNRFLPLEPGTQLILEGTVDGVPHRVVFTVTDLGKVMAGVRTLVIWDTDESDGELVESELSFFAQDEDGNVWNLGEYPEEFEDGEFVGAPSTWITGEEDAEAGIHMAARPRVSSRLYVQGFAPEIDFFDCANVVQKGGQVCVEAGCFRNVLVTNERNLLDPEGGVQSKFHAPGVGIVQIGSVEPANGEILELVDIVHLDRHELREVRREALRLDRRGFRFSEVFGATEPATRLRGRDDDD
jgi:hypothetical protein